MRIRILSLLVGLLTFATGAWLAFAQDSGIPAVHTRALGQLQAETGGIRSVHLRATVRIWLSPPPGSGGTETYGTGSFEYWAEGNRYRVSSRTDRTLGLAQDVDVAFDGTNYQLLDHGMRVLSFQRTEAQDVPSALPNPLFLGVDFLNRETDDCRACRPRLADLADSNLWSARVGSARLATGVAFQGLAPLVMPWGVVNGQQMEFRVFLGGPEGEERPVRIERVTSDGRAVGGVEVASYRTVSTGPEAIHLPESVILTALDLANNGRPIMRSEFQLEIAEVNQSIDKTVFTIDRGLAERVWDSDAKEWVGRENG